MGFEFFSRKKQPEKKVELLPEPAEGPLSEEEKSRLRQEYAVLENLVDQKDNEMEEKRLELDKKEKEAREKQLEAEKVRSEFHKLREEREKLWARRMEIFKTVEGLNSPSKRDGNG